MKILVLADIHANWPALEAVAEQEFDFDECFVLGDLVEYGGQPRETLKWVQTKATAVIRGNHDHAIAQRIQPRDSQSPLKRLRNETREHHFQVMTTAECKYLGQLPLHWSIRRDNQFWGMWHASPRDALYEYMPPRTAAWSSCLTGVLQDVILIGHTHIPYQLAVECKTIINPGSVGFPRDGKPGASYAVWENSTWEIRRAIYDIDDVLKPLEQGGIRPESCRFARRMLETGQLE